MQLHEGFTGCGCDFNNQGVSVAAAAGTHALFVDRRCLTLHQPLHVRYCPVMAQHGQGRCRMVTLWAVLQLLAAMAQAVSFLSRGSCMAVET